MPKKEKGFRKALIMPIFIVVIMVMSVFGFMWGSGRTKLNYNGFKFYQLESGNFMFKVNSYNALFSYYPSELEWLEVPEGTAALFNTPMFYTTSDYNSTYNETIEETKFSIAELLGNTIGVYVKNAFTSETEYSTSVITCSNATPSAPVIYVVKSNITEITLDSNCVTITATDRQEMFMAYERLAYSILGVME
jgi:hypothetical protein